MYDKNTQLNKKERAVKKEKVIEATSQPRNGKTLALEVEKAKLETEKRQPICPDCAGKFVYYRSTEDNFRCRRCGKVFEWKSK